MGRQTKHNRSESLRILQLSAALMILAGVDFPVPALAETPIVNPVKASAVVRCPPESKLRYCDNGDGTVRDNRTGLLWLKDASCGALGPTGDGKGTFEEANTSAAAMRSGQCGLSDASKAGDWRLSTGEEWMNMLNPLFKNPAIGNADGIRKWRQGDAFMNIQSGGYWSSTSDPVTSSYAWGAGLFGGVVASARKSDENFIWPVRNPR